MKKSKILIPVVLFFLVTFFPVNTYSQEGPSIFLKCLPFGIGELSVGKGDFTNIDTKKGVGLLLGQVVAIHGVFSSLGTMESAAEETAYQKAQSDVATNYEDQYEIWEKHTVALENQKDAKTRLYIWTGAFVGLWTFNVIDNFLFASSASKLANDNKVSVKSEIALNRLDNSVINKFEFVKKF